jgi:hypothetical protein
MISLKYLQSVYNTYSPEGYYSGLLSSEFFHLPSISELDILKATKRRSDLMLCLVLLLTFASQNSDRCLNIFSILACHGNTF